MNDPRASTPTHADSGRRSSATVPVFTLLLALVAVSLAACKSELSTESDHAAVTPTTQTGEPASAAELRAAAERESAKPAAAPNLALPLPQPLIDAEARLAAPVGPALDDANADLPAVLTRIATPDYLKPQAPRDKPTLLNPDPPAAAIKAYVRGLAAYRDGQRFEAINQLEAASRLDPDSPRILRLLGKVYFSYRNEVKGAERLTEAVRLDPDDAESLYLLGRVAFGRQQWDEAIAALARSSTASAKPADAQDAAGIDPGLVFERDYYLSQALFERGFDAAAIERAAAFLTLPEHFARTTRLVRELNVLDRQRGRVHQQVGDALCRLGRHAQAIPHYAAAVDGEQVDPDLLTARRAYAALAVARPRSAEYVLVARLADGQSSPALLALVPYVAAHAGRPRAFADVVRSIYQQTDRPSPLALAVAGTLDDSAAAAFLDEHLAARPDDLDAYRFLLNRVGVKQPAAVLPTTLKLVRQHPARARDYTSALTALDVTSERWIELIDALPAAQSDSAAAWYLRGAVHEAADRMELAADCYDKALAADGEFMSPHMATIDLQIRLGRFDKALALIDRIKPPLEDSLRFARVKALVGLRRFDEALLAVDQLIAAVPRNADYRLTKAQIQMAVADLTGAQATLWSILNFSPTNEDAYAALFRLYDDKRWEDASQWMRLLREVQRQIPNSRVAKFYLAVYYINSRQFAQAERPLLDILALTPDDDSALVALVACYRRSDRLPEAEKLLLEHIRKRPTDMVPMLLMEDVARDMGKLPEFYALKEKVLLEREPSYIGYILLARTYLEWDKQDKAVEALDKAAAMRGSAEPEMHIEMARLLHIVKRDDRALAVIDDAVARHPGRAPDLLYFKAILLHGMDRHADAEVALEQALRIDPDHAPSNNDLGYTWADKGVNLDRALEMTRRAVAKDPENGAYLDSLGWVCYKLGRFDEAIAHFEFARTKPDGDDPVILDHYGDALCRANQMPRALQAWNDALRAAANISVDERKDIVKIRTSLTDKIKAAENNTDPPVAPIAEKK